MSANLAENPSSKAYLGPAIEQAYRLAPIEAARQTGLPEAQFPPVCPYGFEQMLDDSFWPDGKQFKG